MQMSERELKGNRKIYDLQAEVKRLQSRIDEAFDELERSEPDDCNIFSVQDILKPNFWKEEK